MGGAVRILVAEDERINQLYMQHLITGAGHEVVLAETGRETIEALADAPVHVILMDVQMPEMDGIEATRRIRAGEAGDERADVPVIALTAYSAPEDRERYEAAGVTRVMVKPPEEQELLAAIEELGGSA